MKLVRSVEEKNHLLDSHGKFQGMMSLDEWDVGNSLLFIHQPSFDHKVHKKLRISYIPFI